MKKIVIAVYGTGNTGKSATVKIVKEALCNHEKSHIHQDIFRANNYDVSTLLNISSVKIGIESEGDPGTPIEMRLNNLVKEDCDIIICTCRTYGSTIDAIKLACGDYEILWIHQSALESAFDESPLRKRANNNKANFILDVIWKYYSIEC